MVLDFPGIQRYFFLNPQKDTPISITFNIIGGKSGRQSKQEVRKNGVRTRCSLSGWR